MNKLKKSACHAWNGIVYVFQNEKNFKIHIAAGVLVLCAGFVFDFEVWKYIVLLLLISQMLVVEIINSAIEYTWDHLEPNHHPVVGIIKDVTAGAVLISAIASVIIGILLFVF